MGAIVHLIGGLALLFGAMFTGAAIYVSGDSGVTSGSLPADAVQASDWLMHPAWNLQTNPTPDVGLVFLSEAITDIDVTGAGIIDQLDVELNADGIHMAFVEMRDRLQDLVRRYGLLETLDSEHFYPTIDRAIVAIRGERA